ncbi:hypothetical protein SBRCBS47491_001303 [Sporothrix bragantina]|uniref:Uncharacterized protein n=1 Tax=Sporothrix bragantina TaxID=671064 RepID=A0ABP0AXP1_9PEZI
MAPAVESTSTDVFHRSHSTPDLLPLRPLPKEPLLPRSTHTHTHAHNALGHHRHTAGTPTLATAAPTLFTKAATTSTSFTSTSTSTNTSSLASAALLASASSPNVSSLSSFSSLSPSSTLSSLSSLKSSSTTDLASKSLPSLPAFDVPSFDFDIDLDAELEFSILRKSKSPAKSKPRTEPPRRVWEEFITTPAATAESASTITNSYSTSFASEFEAELASKFGPATTAATAPTAEAKFLDRTSSLVGASSTLDLTLPKRPSTAIAPSERQKAIDNEKSAAAEAAATTTIATDSERLGRRKTLVDRPLSWIPGSRSETDFDELLTKEREKEARRAHLAAIAAANAEDKDERTAAITANTLLATAQSTQIPTLLVEDSDRMVERQRTMSASFVDFARRSWMSRSPSPAPQSPRYPKTEKEGKEGSRTTGRLMRKRPVSTVVLLSSSNSKHNGNNDDTAVEALPKEGKEGSLNLNTSLSGSDSAARTASNADGVKAPIGSVAAAAQGTNANANGATAAATPTTAATPTATTSSTTTSIPTITTTTIAASSSSTSTSRTFSRASTYLSRMKQRPQSMFVKVASGNDTDDSDKAKTDDEANGRTPNNAANRISSAALSSLLPPGAASGHSGSSSSSAASSNNSSSGISDDGSSDGSANGSTLLPASEAESLTTADNSNASSQGSPMTHPTSRDPLWVAFKDLETNFFKFLSKTTTAQRMILVRATLIPFLRRYAADSANPGTSAKANALLAPEDVERRASILNRWWTGLLEMLDGPSQTQQGNMGQGQGGLFGGSTFFGTSTTTNGNFYAVTGVDRPVVLECMSLIMSRPEWRLLTAVFRPLTERSPGERVRARSNTSESHTRPTLDESAFLVEESAEHNVRTMFINNLLAQLILVVDKMALRQAPISIVNFSGKACAYAFFFVPGVADILIRLWSLDKNIELVRRVADAFGLPRRSKGESEDLVALFPPSIGPLGWSSVSAMQAKLRRPPRMSLLPPAYVSACSRVSWFAPCWLSRWRGADTDLLFIFCKYYHVLADEFMPASLQLPLVEKARAPGFVLLHAQLLQIFDNTIHRQAAVEAAMMMAGTPMTDGTPSLWMQQQMQQRQPYLVASSDDAFVPSFMMQPNHNLFRDMDENRIIALLRDLLSSDDTLAGARATFAGAAMVLLKAATLRTSQYDHNACYILCDFLNEILQTFDNYYGYAQGRSADEDAAAGLVDFVDWTFWLDVCKMMLDSNNTMSEIRVLSFVFATWDIVAADPGRKEALCVGWLLSEEVFDKFFNNWCPMVRAYYMRLLCWRMCRDAGSSNELDAKIFQLVSQRLKTVWSHYLWLKNKSDIDGTLPPSTAPSLPQPGKRFMIVRTEVTMPQPGLLVNALANTGAGRNNRPATTFDALASSVNGINPSSNVGPVSFGSEPGTSGLSLTASSTTDDKKADASSAKKKWSLLGKVLNLTSKPPSDEEFEQMRRDTAVAITASKQQSGNGNGGPALPSKSSPAPRRLGSPPSDSDSSTGSTPVFDASQFVFKFALHNIPWQGFGGGQGEIMLPPAYRERVLTRPRLPAPAQARVSSRMAATGRRSESPPPPAAGLPPITRRVSGFATGGLINEARNANPAESVPLDDDMSGSASSSRSGSISSGRPSLGYRRNSSPPMHHSQQQDTSRERSSYSSDESNAEFDLDRERILVQPTEPKGHDAMMRAKYAGRALAEWSLVVSECNSFIDRRRDEGVYGLKDVEVPTLGVEGMRRLG